MVSYSNTNEWSVIDHYFTGPDPETLAQCALSAGKITQEEFDAYLSFKNKRNFNNQITGNRKYLYELAEKYGYILTKNVEEEVEVEE